MMDIVTKLRGIDSKIQINGRSEYKVTVEKQKEYLESLCEPDTLLKRSFNQYLCQKYLKNRFVNLAMGIGSFFVYFILKKKYSHYRINCNEKADAIFLPDGKSSDVIPKSLRHQYKTIANETEKKYLLDSSSLLFVKKIEKEYKRYWLFKLKVLVKIARYNYLIEYYNPQALIVCNEYSFTSAIVSEFCQNRGVELINVMHGEKLYSLQEAFFYFPVCYVWNDYYIALFNSLRAYCDKYIVELPESMVIPNSIENKSIDYTYYLQEESGDVLNTIINNMLKLKNRGFRVAIRPHPRYTNVKELDNVDIEIEDYKIISIRDSLTRTLCAISFCSTVLNQAYCNGISVVIDDIARSNEYNVLLKKEYIITRVEHKLLSEIINQ